MSPVARMLNNTCFSKRTLDLFQGPNCYIQPTTTAASVLVCCLLQVKPVVDITWFSWQLWRLTGRRGMAFLYLYSLLGFACLKLVTPDFGLLANTEYRLEGAFR